MANCGLFIAPLFKIPEFRFVTDSDPESIFRILLHACTDLDYSSVKSVELSRNRNAVTIFFANETFSNMAKKYLGMTFPELSVKYAKSLNANTRSEDLVPIPLTFPNALLPKGLVIIPDWVSEEEELELMKDIDSREWNPTIRRRVQHYGYTFEYSRLDVDKTADPTRMPPKCEKLLECGMLRDEGFNQLTINEYVPGVGIASHCDTHSAFTDTIAVVSLLAPITMDFVSQDASSKVSVVIPARSLFLMGGESRYGWRHSIASRKSDRDAVSGLLVSRSRRVSLTFRNCTTKICFCQFPSLCDSQGADVIRPRRMQDG